MEYGEIIRKLPVPETRKTRERDIHIMTRRKYDPEEGKMCDRDTRKQNPAEST